MEAFCGYTSLDAAVAAEQEFRDDSVKWFLAHLLQHGLRPAAAEIVAQSCAKLARFQIHPVPSYHPGVFATLRIMVVVEDA